MLKKARTIDCAGSVLFPGSISPRLEEFDSALRAAGVRVTAMPKTDGAHWSAQLEHPAWGKAMAISLRNVPKFPRELVLHDARLSDEERQEALRGEGSVTVKVSGDTNATALRDRKRLLHYLGLFMGTDGVAAIDHAGEHIWSRAALDDELSHDADVDIDALFSLHAVGDPESAGEKQQRCAWLHTHGLDRIGCLDFDIIDPAEDLLGRAYDTVRAMAFAMLEEKVTRETPEFEAYSPGGKVRFVDVGEFAARGMTPKLRELGVGGESHDTNRVVACDPVGAKAGGWLSRLFGRGGGGDGPRPSKALSRPLGDNVISHFSAAATQLMADRARATYGLFRRLRNEFAEFADLGFTPIAKIAYETDSGSNGGREHLWFSVEDLRDDGIDATLASQPFNIAAMKPGDRAVHPLERLSDWAIVTPAGMINPRNTAPARRLRPRLPDLRRIVAEQRGKA